MQPYSQKRTHNQRSRYRRELGWRRYLMPVIACLALLAAGVIGPMPAAEGISENQFGPPWLGVVVVDSAASHAKPSLDSPVNHTIGADAMLPVLSEVRGGSGPDGNAAWYETTLGFVPVTVVREYREPWIAEVAESTIELRAKPNADSDVRRTAQAGDLLRVTGLSPGLEGDTNIWWATTEGYTHLDSIDPTRDRVDGVWPLPDAQEALHGWWGEITDIANVRVSASAEATKVGSLYANQRVKVLNEVQGDEVEGSSAWYRIDGGRFAGAYVHSSLINRIKQPRANLTPLAGTSGVQTWINVDRQNSTLTFIQNGAPIFVTYVSLGKAGRDTPPGVKTTFGKLLYDDMTSASLPGSDRHYDLPNVPYTQYFDYSGYALHGTYWHDEYGSDESQGCINVTVTDGAYLFHLTTPALSSGANSVWVGELDGTPLQILD